MLLPVEELCPGVVDGPDVPGDVTELDRGVDDELGNL